MNFRFVDIIRNWDARDLRTIIITIIVLIIPIYFRSVITFISDAASGVSDTISTKFIDHLYLISSGNPVTYVLLLIYIMIFVLPLMIIFINKASLVREGMLLNIKTNVIRRFLLARSRGFHILISIISLTLSVLLVVLSFSSVAVPLIAYIDFNQKTAALSPYFTDQEKGLLTSKWALMTTKKDHDDVIRYLHDIANAHGVKLPSAFN